MTRSLVQYRKPSKYPLRTMAVGATFTLTFDHWRKRDDFRRNTHKVGRDIGKRFQCVTDGLTLTVMRIR